MRYYFLITYSFCCTIKDEYHKIKSNKTTVGLYNLHSYYNRFGTVYSIFVQLKFGNMKKNMGIADRIIRLIITAVIAVLYFTHILTGVLGIVLLVLAGIFLLTSIVGFCPLYFPFRLSTLSRKKE